MADTKGKYAVDIEDVAEEEEGVPQWAIFAGIGGLLLVIIIIIIVVVAGGTKEASKDKKKETNTTTPATPAKVVLTTDQATSQEQAEKLVGQEMTVAGVKVTVVDVVAQIQAQQGDGYDPTKDEGGIVPVETTMVVTMSVPAGTDIAELERQLAATNEKDVAKALGVDVSWVTVLAKWVPTTTRALSAGVRSLAGAGGGMIMTQSMLLPAATVTFAKQVAKQGAMKALATATASIPGLTAEAIGDIVQATGAPIQASGNSTEDFAAAISVAKAVLAVASEAAATNAVALAAVVATGELVNYAALVTELVQNSTEAGAADMAAAVTAAAGDTVISVGGATGDDIADAFKEVTTVAVAKENLKPPPTTTATPTTPPTTTKTTTPTTPTTTTTAARAAPPPSNGTNSTSGSAARTRVRRGLAEAASSYYSQLVDRLVV